MGPLFAQSDDGFAPLAERMRPRTLDEYVGQQHLLGSGKLLRSLLEGKQLRSLLFWGPPGTGKTTLAKLYAEAVGASFRPISAVTGGVKDVRAAVEGARIAGISQGRRTAVFIDEIHRFNKAQQDALLPHVERGTITLLGATTENPSFEVNGALLSRCKVLTLHPLDDEAVAQVLGRALREPERGIGPTAPELGAAARDALIGAAEGDLRTALNTLEIAADLAQLRAAKGTAGEITVDDVAEAQQKRTLRYDKAGDQHYRVVSAFIKAMRGSDPDGALYYMVRMLEAGEDPKFVLRRMVIFASEDIGNADPQALQVAINAQQAFQFVGMPEGVLAMTQAVTYLSTAPKSNAALTAYGRTRKAVNEHGTLPVPSHLVNAPTALMKSMGYGRGYKYPHNFDGHYVAERYLPERLSDLVFYTPSDSGFERTIAERMKAWRETSS